jgi:large subunit ribosomal protein L4
MATVDVRNLKNDVVGQVDLDDRVFGAPLNRALIYDAVKAYLSNQRTGTVSTKTRGEASGSGRKLWKQKGTGRARIASIRSPLWKGGGNTHGPKPRDWEIRVPKKMRRKALCSALSERLREGRITVVDDLTLQDHKTKGFVSVLAALGHDRKTLVVAGPDNRNLQLAGRNIQTVTLSTGAGINVYDVLAHDRLLFSRDAIVRLSEQLAESQGGR